MKKLLILILLGFAASCSRQVSAPAQEPPSFCLKCSLYDKLQDDHQLLMIKNDSINELLSVLIERAEQEKKRADSLQQSLYIAHYKIERINHYIDICKKESNKKFLYGWIRRVLEK